MVEVLGEVGFGGLTVDAVAARAQAGKATIYRRWPTKVALVTDAAQHVVSTQLPDPDTGELRADLIAVFTSIADMLTSEVGRVGRALIGEMSQYPELSNAFRAGPIDNFRALCTAAMRRAIERGEIDPAVDTDLIGEAAGSVLSTRWLITGDPLDEELVVRVVDTIVLPLCRPAPD